MCRYVSKAGDIQKSAASNYKTLEKSSNIGPVVFEKYDKPKVRGSPNAGRPRC